MCIIYEQSLKPLYVKNTYPLRKYVPSNDVRMCCRYGNLYDHCVMKEISLARKETIKFIILFGLIVLYDGINSFSRITFYQWRIIYVPGVKVIQ